MVFNDHIFVNLAYNKIANYQSMLYCNNKTKNSQNYKGK